MKASKIFMVRPVNFGYNEQTAGSNSFQNKSSSTISNNIQSQALEEFNNLVNKLKDNNIEVIIFDDTLTPHTPDSIFPNNWISFHENNTIVLYPMLAKNRRRERRDDIINKFKNEETKLIDLTDYENKNIFLEGTGSIVFDYINKIAYANISPRTNIILLENLCLRLGFKLISFKAIDKNNTEIYHTNVLMCIGDSFAVLCSDCIVDKSDLQKVKDSLDKTNHKIIEISYSQMNSFAGNMYQLYNQEGKSFIVMSEQAFLSLAEEQKSILKSHGEIIYSSLYTIEKYGGGSARCMIADIRL